jgi:hypothetical protein
MSDLRTRIMAALSKEDQLRVCKLSDADIRFMADAVIRELNLHQDESYGTTYPNIPIEDRRDDLVRELSGD